MGIAARLPGLKAYILSFFQDSAPTNGTTTKVPTVNAVYDAIETAKGAVVAQTITNGVTTSAPSQDAVYDALLLKADTTGVASFMLAGQASAPAAPAAGYYKLYVLTADGKLRIKDSADSTTVVGTQS